MNTYWSRLNQLLLLGMLVGLTSCQPTVDEQPQILSMSIAGIPQQNITIDQVQHLITVALPPTLPPLELVPSFTFSRQAHLADPITVSLTKCCPCLADRVGGDYTTVARLVDRVDNKRQSTHYTFLFKSGGPLRIRPLLTPIVYDSKSNSEITIPVENSYTFSGGFVMSIAVTPTGSATPNRMSADGVPMARCTDHLNELAISLSGYAKSLKPGLHDLDLWTVDGTNVHATGAILVK